MQVRLKVLSGKSAGKELHVPYEEFLIGRSDVCHLRPKSDAISRKHCRLLIEGGTVWVEDLGSRNGTFVNGERIAERRVVRSGDRLRIGRLEFEFVIEALTPAVSSAPKEPVEMKEETWADEEITRWLEEAAAENSDPGKQLRLDPAERSLVDTALNRAPTESTVIATPSEPVSSQTSPTGAPPAQSEAKPEQKKPSKLPPRNIVQAANSGEAAAQMLKKFFTRP